MKREVLSAANFLVDLVRLNGSEGPLSDEQLSKFKDNVCECLWVHYTDHWFPEKPDRGSGYRCIRINGKMDPLLARAGALMGLAAAALRKLFPQELTMWVDPKEVSYRIGENGSICSLSQACDRSSKTGETSVLKKAELKSPEKPSSPTQRRPSSSPVSILSPNKQQFSPSKSPSPSSPVQLRYNTHHPSPPASPPLAPSIREQQLTLQQQQLLFLMNTHNGSSTTNCKDVLRPVLDSNHGMERLFVSS